MIGCLYNSYLFFIAAEDIIKSIDEKIDPCDDFYQFSCGNFLRKGSYKEEYSYAATDIIEKRLNEVRDLDEELYDLEALKKMRLFIQRCIDNGIKLKFLNNFRFLQSYILKAMATP